MTIALDSNEIRVPRPCRVTDWAGIGPLLLKSEIDNLQSI
jgi:hypothetical protein